MIVTKKGWIWLILSVHGSALPRIAVRLAVTLLVAVAVTLLHNRYGYFETSLTPLPFTLIGLAVSIFLGFRNNTSYDRFWEGRRLWGSLVNTSRTLSRQILTLIRTNGESNPTAQQRVLVHRVIAYVHLLRLHLRQEKTCPELEALLPADLLARVNAHTNRPVALLQSLGVEFADAWRRGDIETYHLPVLEHSLSQLTDIQGGCERIQSTPIPFSYTVAIHQLVGFYCFALPFGITDAVGPLTPLVVLLVAYAFLSLDAIGDEIEEPFGSDANDLALGAISRTIEINLRQALGEPAPPPAEPLGGTLT